MSYRVRLHKAIENTPESILAIVFDFLEFLKSKNAYAKSDYDEALDNTDLESLSGIFYDPAQRAISLEEMDKAIAQAVAESL